MRSVPSVAMVAAAMAEQAAENSENNPSQDVAPASVSEDAPAAIEAPAPDAPAEAPVEAPVEARPGSDEEETSPGRTSSPPVETAEAAREEPAEEPEPENPEPENREPASPHPYLVVTVLVDAGARPAVVTCSHGDAMERAIAASEGRELAGLDLVELPISPAPFGALRKALSLPDDVVGLYDLFPLASHLGEQVRKVAGQFLAAEAVWTLEEQGLLGGVPLNVRLDMPKGWSRDPKAVHEQLVKAGALELTSEGIETFKVVKTAWDRSNA